MPKCDSTHYDTYKWACTRRELPSEKFKHTCADLRAREHVEYPSCDVILDYEGCNSAYVAFGSIDVDGIKLCGWDWSRSMCTDKGELHYGCKLARGSFKRTFEQDTRRTDNAALSFQLGPSRISLTRVQVGLIAVIVVLLAFICCSGSSTVQPSNGRRHDRVLVNPKPGQVKIIGKGTTRGKSKSFHIEPLVRSPLMRKNGSKKSLCTTMQRTMDSSSPVHHAI